MQPLLLLHGALGSSQQMAGLSDKLSTVFDVHLLNFSGHGGLDFPDGGFSIEVFANDVIRYLEEKSLSAVNVFGYSMGGYVALYLARHYPQFVEKIFTLGTKFDWTPDEAKKEVKQLDTDKILEKVPRFAQMLTQRHSPQDWKQVLASTGTMMLNLGDQPGLTNEDFESLSHPILLAVGDKDHTAGTEATLQVYNLLQNGQLLVLPNTLHPIEKVDFEILSHHIRLFVHEKP